MNIQCPPPHVLKESPELVEKLAAAVAHDFVNNYLMACKSGEEVVEVQDFLSAFGGEMISKLLGTIIMNRYKQNGKSQEVCKEMANALAADHGIKIAETTRGHIDDMFNNKTVTQLHAIKGKKPEGL